VNHITRLDRQQLKQRRNLIRSHGQSIYFGARPTPSIPKVFDLLHKDVAAKEARAKALEEMKKEPVDVTNAASTWRVVGAKKIVG
jgi:hypothetical protein